MATDRSDPTEPSDQPAAPRWGFGDAVIGFVVGIVLSSVLASLWVSFHHHPGHGDELSLGGQGLAQLGLWTGLAGGPILAARRKGSGRVSLDFGFRARWWDLPIGIVAGAVAHEWILWVVAQLMRPFVGQPSVSGPTEKLVTAAHGIETVGLVLFVAVGAPLVEELFFRGLVLRSLQRRFGTVWAVILSSALFGLAHSQSLPAGALVLVMVSLATLGAVLAILVLRTNRLGPAIVAHAVFNAWTVFFLLRH